MFLNALENVLLKGYFKLIIKKLEKTVFLLLMSAQVMAMQYRILDGKLMPLGVVEEFSEKSSTVTYIPSGSYDTHAEQVIPTSSGYSNDETHQNEITIWQLFLWIQKGFAIPKKIILVSSFFTGQTLYLVQSNSKLKNSVRGFRLVNSDNSQHWDIFIMVRGDARRLRGAVIRGVIIMVNGQLSNVIIPPGDWTEVKTACVEKLEIFNPRKGNETVSVGEYQPKPPPPPPLGSPAYMNMFQVHLANDVRQQ